MASQKCSLSPVDNPCPNVGCPSWCQLSGPTRFLRSRRLSREAGSSCSVRAAEPRPRKNSFSSSQVIIANHAGRQVRYRSECRTCFVRSSSTRLIRLLSLRSRKFPVLRYLVEFSAVSLSAMKSARRATNRHLEGISTRIIFAVIARSAFVRVQGRTLLVPCVRAKF
jgi:hypothetical protein